LFCGLVAFGIYGQAAENHALDDRVDTLSHQNAALQQQIADRQREIVEAQTPAWLQEEARKLGYVSPGEKIFVIAPPGSAPSQTGGVNAPLPSFSPLPTLSPSPSASASPAASPSGSPAPGATSGPSPTGSPTPH
jgi:hypothetical protein